MEGFHLILLEHLSFSPGSCKILPYSDHGGRVSPAQTSFLFCLLTVLWEGKTSPLSRGRETASPSYWRFLLGPLLGPSCPLPSLGGTGFLVLGNPQRKGLEG